MGNFNYNFFKVGEKFNALVISDKHPLISSSNNENLLNTIIYCSDVSMYEGTISNGSWIKIGEKIKDIEKKYMEKIRLILSNGDFFQELDIIEKTIIENKDKWSKYYAKTNLIDIAIERLLRYIFYKDLVSEIKNIYSSPISCDLAFIMDDCVLNIDSKKRIDLTARKRNNNVECNCEDAEQYLNVIINKLNKIDCKVEDKIFVIDDLGLGKTEIQYTLGAVFAQANSHAIHHYAIINYILDNLGIKFHDVDFGYNPTTPRLEINLN